MATQLPKFFESIDITSDGSLVLATSNLTTRVWSGLICSFDKIPEGVPNKADCTGTVSLDFTVGCLKVVPRTEKFLCGCDTGAVMLWEMSKTDAGVKFACNGGPTEHDSFVSALSINASFQRAVSASEDRRIKVWDLDEMASVRSLQGHSMGVLSVDCHPSEDDVFASTARDGQLIVWDSRFSVAGQIIGQNSSLAAPTTVQWVRGKDRVLVVGREDGTVTVHDTRVLSPQPLAALAVHSRTVARLASSPDGQLMATSSEDCTVKVLDVTAKIPSLVYASELHTDFVYGLCWQSARDLISCGWDSAVHRHSPALRHAANGNSANMDTA